MYVAIFLVLIFFQVEVPMTLVLTILTLYLLFGGAIFSLTEGWTLLESTYFSLITLTTIGFGGII